ncbi:hypothetical protein DTO013E5_4371 [Penicillium roqueforti]|uniref:uncharacterized protein n=1 Tax=Penicillium roqueforti TaxID=5082 RepID=UPI00190A1C57|nr:uncharacterized protein LCP9604111_4534 [Penicillium roqueforti]KAF9249378.1 hypothetical protein LCP9604111_4534 [Penicillium roqueforti]KAI1834110.1 hypothetical protein CBS147337_5074 [Penicillium roqueforti]KAI2674900.1 hypothetical protein CBS147355_6714 [Penicillium roqueforti]KAI2688158.1 hypothetical protein LCP963914a_2560 [Penicillium roqueforti]KAI2699830.1 hypothetical protein CBS147372_6140 [Penicillium roqueforti]
MPSYKNNPSDEEYLDSIKKHTDKETNNVNLARVAKDFSYASGKSFQKKYAKLKKAHNLTNGHIYGDYKPEAAQTPPKKAIKTVTEIVREAGEASVNRRSAMLKGKGSEKDKKKQA